MTQAVKNIVFLGHGDSGKTTLVEALLHTLGKIKQRGGVEEGSTASDFDPEEKERKFSIDLSVFSTSFQGYSLTLLDAPGYPDFIGEAYAGIAAADFCFLHIHAVSGIMVNTRKIWSVLSELQKPTALLITKCDLDNINFDQILSDVHEQLSPKATLLTFPNDTGRNLAGVISLLSSASTPNLSGAFVSRTKDLSNQLKESLVETDDHLMEQYLEKGEIEEETLKKAILPALQTRRFIPILCLSAKQNVGLQELIDFILSYVPGYSETASLNLMSGDPPEAKTVSRRDLQGSLVQVFKTVSDPYVGKVAYLKTLGNSPISPETILTNKRTANPLKLIKLARVFGKDQVPVEKLDPGEIGVVTKIEELQPGDTLTTDLSLRLSPLSYPTPMVSLAVEPKSRDDEQRISTALNRMAESDPCFRVLRQRETVELVISGISNLHIDIVLSRLKRKYQLEIVTRQPKVPYKETILGKAEGHHKHKKQTGGRGQYGEVYLRLEPMERGQGFEFVDDVVQGRIPNQYIPACEKGIREILDKGILAGHPIIDVRAAVFDGTYHDVDSSEASFKIAASKAFKDAFSKAKPVLLEPIVNVEIFVPSHLTGDITGDLISRRARISGMDSHGRFSITHGQVPLSEIMDYSTQLRAITAGEGYYSIEFSHYDPVPQKIQEQLIARSQKQKEEDEE